MTEIPDHIQELMAKSPDPEAEAEAWDILVAEDKELREAAAKRQLEQVEWKEGQ